eukprot:COSAG02_NODE_17_length_55377_cov_106.402258_21_plen_306_part_00
MVQLPQTEFSHSFFFSAEFSCIYENVLRPKVMGLWQSYSRYRMNSTTVYTCTPTLRACGGRWHSSCWDSGVAAGGLEYARRALRQVVVVATGASPQQADGVKIIADRARYPVIALQNTESPGLANFVATQITDRAKRDHEEFLYDHARDQCWSGRSTNSEGLEVPLSNDEVAIMDCVQNHPQPSLLYTVDASKKRKGEQRSGADALREHLASVPVSVTTGQSLGAKQSPMALGERPPLARPAAQPPATLSAGSPPPHPPTQLPLCARRARAVTPTPTWLGNAQPSATIHRQNLISVTQSNHAIDY